MIKWHKRFLALAEHVADWSKDPSTKVGCVLVNDKNQVVGMGYNGFPRGVEDHAGRYENRDIKYLMVQHAEANAVMNATESTDGVRAYVTHHPCSTCAGLLIQAGVASIIINPQGEGGLAERYRDSFNAARTMCKEAGVGIMDLGEFDGK